MLFWRSIPAVVRHSRVVSNHLLVTRWRHHSSSSSSSETPVWLMQGAFTGRFMSVSERVHGKMATTVEIHPSFITTIFLTHVSLCCKKQTTFWLYFRKHYQLQTQPRAKWPVIGRWEFQSRGLPEAGTNSPYTVFAGHWSLCWNRPIGHLDK